MFLDKLKFDSNEINLHIFGVNDNKEDEPEFIQVDFKCDECGFVAKNGNGLRMHKKKHK
jgi:hypothetical protein